MLKNLILYWLLALVFFTTACNKDDSPFPKSFEFPSVYKLTGSSLNTGHFWKLGGSINNPTFLPITKSEYVSVAGEFEDLTVDDIIDSMTNSWIIASELQFIDEENVNLLGLNYFGETYDIEGLKYKWEDKFLTIFGQDGEETLTFMSASLNYEGSLTSYIYVYQFLNLENGPRRSPFFFEIVEKYSGSIAIKESIVKGHGLKSDDFLMLVEKQHQFKR